MKKQDYRIQLKRLDDGRYMVTVPSIPGCVCYGNSLELAMAMARHSIRIYQEKINYHGVDYTET